MQISIVGFRLDHVIAPTRGCITQQKMWFTLTLVKVLCFTTNCSPYRLHTSDIAAPYASYTFTCKSC